MTVISLMGDTLDISLTLLVDASKTHGIDVELITLPLPHLMHGSLHIASPRFALVKTPQYHGTRGSRFNIYVSYLCVLHLSVI